MQLLADVKGMLYDLEQAYWNNLKKPCSLGKLTQLPRPSPQHWGDFLGMPLATPVGVAACPLTTAQGVRYLTQLGYDLITYKTVRSGYYEPYAWPNIKYVKGADVYQLKQHAPPKLTVSDQKTENLANSLGMPSYDLETNQTDIAYAKEFLLPGQILLVSVYGNGDSINRWLEDLIKVGTAVKEAGADALELNLSCPNVQGAMISNHLSELTDALKRFVRVMKPVPVLTKLAWLSSNARLEHMLESFARAGILGVTGINSRQIQLLTPEGKPAFGEERQICGLSGAAIRPLALDFVKRSSVIIQNKKLDLALLGAGGVTAPHHFDDMLEAGADVALAATGVMLNPYLAQERMNGVHQREFN